MNVKRAGKKQIYKKCVIVLICLFIAGNSVHGVVLCFGADGHIEIESAFHESCDECAHSEPINQKQISFQVGHVKDKHCEPCVDIPLSIGLTNIICVSKQLNPTFPAPVGNVILLAEKFNFGAYNSSSSGFDAFSYFAPLRTVVLLI